jgi:hypothetical protein
MVNGRARGSPKQDALPPRPIGFISYGRGLGGLKMPTAVSTAIVSRPLVLAGVAAGIAVLVTLVLWAWYGTAMFFEMVRAGWAACF